MPLLISEAIIVFVWSVVVAMLALSRRYARCWTHKTRIAAVSHERRCGTTVVFKVVAVLAIIFPSCIPVSPVTTCLLYVHGQSSCQIGIRSDIGKAGRI